MQSTTNFRPVSLKKEVGHFSRNLWPRICKKSQKKQVFKKKFFFPRNNLKRLKIRSQHHLCSPRKIAGLYLSKKKLVIFQEICDPGYAKKSKIANFQKNFFSLKTTQNALKFVRNTICAVHDKFPVGIYQKRCWSFFKKSVTPDMQKKSKNFKFLEKFFFARNTLKCLKICSQHHLCSPRQISGRYLSKKKLLIFQEICDPGYAKKVKKASFQKKIFFPSKQPKAP